MRLTGKVVLVTGATYGIGAAIVERVAEEGASVLFTGRTADIGREREADLRTRGLVVSYLKADSGNEQEVRHAVQRTVEEYGAITTVVNNAIASDITRPDGGDTHVHEIDSEAAETIIRVGVLGTLWACKYALPHMIENRSGSIVNISAASSLRAMPGRPAYQASKGAVNALTRQMAVEYGPVGIRSNAIVVGITPTGGDVMDQLIANETFMTSARQAVPSTRLGRPTDIANGVVYLASDEGEFVNGVLLPIDGGYTCRLGIPDTSSLEALDDA